MVPILGVGSSRSFSRNCLYVKYKARNSRLGPKKMCKIHRMLAFFHPIRVLLVAL